MKCDEASIYIRLVFVCASFRFFAFSRSSYISRQAFQIRIRRALLTFPSSAYALPPARLMNDIALASNHYVLYPCLVGSCSCSNSKCCSYCSSIMTEAYFQIALEMFYPIRVRGLQNQAFGRFEIGHLIVRCAVLSVGMRSTTWRGGILYHGIVSSVLFQLLFCNRFCN
ncbi:hypothetical protein BDZ45DRAFT_35305 [Acephala macrosclerotiorum]|nr:hypothetical protein BDZ45DRAFT_35305 [Acephala macrosclerotiorum]